MFYSTVFAGVGVDIRVHKTVVLGLSENMENLLQEGGRSMRGSVKETSGQLGISFFLHKGALGKIVRYSKRIKLKDQTRGELSCAKLSQWSKKANLRLSVTWFGYFGIELWLGQSLSFSSSLLDEHKLH